MSASYYAVNAKVRALYGRRMTAEDYRLLQEKRTIPEAAAFLQAHPGYRDRLSGLNTVSMHREMLEIALRCSYVDEYRRIFSFMSLTDKELMRFPVYKAEHAVILLICPPFTRQRHSRKLLRQLLALSMVRH